MARLGSAVRGAIDEIFPRVTAVDADGRPFDPFTPDPPSAYCGRCGATCGPGAADASGCAFCRGERIAWDGLTRLGAYADPLDAHIREMKFAQQWRWAPWLGEHLARVLPSMGERVVVEGVPMWWRRRWRRGYNQAQLMADAVAARRGWRVAPILRRTKHTHPQVSVGFSSRAANVAGSFTIEPVDLRGWTVVLVDDVKTSGSTLAACTRLLKQAKADRVHVAVAAVADPRGGDFTRIDA